jgi:Holliday junction DNA helicase RuvA
MMLGYLRGQILGTASENDGKIILGIGAAETGMVGYSVNVPRNTQYELLPNGKLIELFIHTHVREDQLDLYGFGTKSEKEFFLTLLSVNGIGPKGALSILSAADTALLVQAIVDGDKALLTKIPGIGKKTAERMVLELSDSLRKKMALTPQISSKSPKATGAQGSPQPSVMRDARDALVGLGYRETDVSSLLSKVFAEFDTPPKTEELIKTALRQLA